MDNPYTDSAGDYRPIELSEVAESSAAYAAARASWRAVNARDREAWLAMWAEDGHIEDPVGPSMFDPEGRGHRGYERLVEFWEKAVSTPDHIEFRFDRAIACGDELACTGIIRTHLGDQVMDAAGAVIYRVDGSGKMLSLRAFWESDLAMSTFRPAEEA